MSDHAKALAEALREAQRFMSYFSGETGGSFAGPGTPATCLSKIRAALAAYDAAPASDAYAAGMRRAAEMLTNAKRDEAYDAAEKAARHVSCGQWGTHISHTWTECGAFHKAWEAARSTILAAIPPAEPWQPPSVRTWPHYPVPMPVTADGKGPATIGVDAVAIEYEVWEAEPPHHAVASFDNLPDAINEAMRISFAPEPAGEEKNK